MRWGTVLVNEWMTSKNQSHRADPAVPAPWLTVEITLWGLLFVTAVGLRLLRLDSAPLNAHEARGALAALRFSHGQGPPATMGYSPALFSGQWLTFLIFGANDLTARFLPALAGSVLVLTPALLRPQLGRLGALATGTLFALSPTALILSRTASGDTLVALGAMLCVGALWRYLYGVDPERPVPRHSLSRFPLLFALGIALMMVAGPLAYSALLAIGSALLVSVLVDTESRETLRRGWLAARETPNLVYTTLGALLGGVVLLGTTFAWHLEGMAATADLLTVWLGGFIRWPDSLGFTYPLLLLVFYELLIVLAGTTGVALTIARGNPFSRFTALWGLAALLLALIRPGRGPGDVLLILLPLACLGGLALEALFEGVRRRGRWLGEGIYLAVTLPLWAYLLISLATYSSRSGQFSNLNLPLISLSLPTFLSLAVVATILLIIMAIGIASMQGTETALRGLGLSALAALLCITFATAWGVSQNRSSDPRELLVVEPTSTEVRLLKDSLSRASREHSGDAHSIDVTVLTNDPALRWVLRDFDQARFAEPSETAVITSAVVALQAPGTPSLGGDYFGQSFALRRRWETDDLLCRWNIVQIGLDQVSQLDCRALADWLLYRRSAEQPVEDQVVLWLRQELLGW